MDSKLDSPNLLSPKNVQPASNIDVSSSESEEDDKRIEWLATSRQRRSTAGNRMKSMLANEEPDSDLELLFAEDEDDQGFSDMDGDGSDAEMGSSSDDEEENNVDGDLAGEQELERRAREKRAAQRKRKAQDSIPAKFRKKVRTTKDRPASTAIVAPSAVPDPRPKKKSERVSWLPTVGDLPTRASSRQTTRVSKEQLHVQMAEREERRLKQLAQMQKRMARLEAMKKAPMTQAERLAEAAKVEEKNSKSLNRWEEAEKQREEERKARLAALNQRTLKGPVLTFWSGKGEWDEGRLRRVGQLVVIEEKPKKAKKEKLEKEKIKSELTINVKSECDNGTSTGSDDGQSSGSQPHESSRAPSDEQNDNNNATAAPMNKSNALLLMNKPASPGVKKSSDDNLQQHSKQNQLVIDVTPTTKMFPNASTSPRPGSGSGSGSAVSLSLNIPHDLATTPTTGNTKSTAGVSNTDLAAKSQGFPPQSSANNAIRSTAQLPQRPASVVSDPLTISSNGIDDAASKLHSRPNDQQSPKDSFHTNSTDKVTSIPDVIATRNAIVYQNFDEAAIRDKTVQTEILLGRRMTKLPSQSSPFLAL